MHVDRLFRAEEQGEKMSSSFGAGAWTASSSGTVNINNANNANGSSSSNSIYTNGIGNGSSSGGITISPYGTGTNGTGVCTCGQNCGGSLCGNGYWYQQPYYQPSNITFHTMSTPNQKYSVMDLPRKDMPTSVYVCGRMVTLGILGTDVECAYVGEYLVFAPGIVNYVWNSRTTVIVEYKDEIYHYNIGANGTDMYAKESSKLNAILVSTIKK